MGTPLSVAVTLVPRHRRYDRISNFFKSFLAHSLSVVTAPLALMMKQYFPSPL